MLGVVPQGGHRVAVVVIERQGVGAGQQIEVVHKPAIDGFLLVGVIVVVAAGDEVAGHTVGPPRIGDIGIVGQQSGGKTVDGRVVVHGNELGLALRVRRGRTGGAIIRMARWRDS